MKVENVETVSDLKTLVAESLAQGYIEHPELREGFRTRPDLVAAVASTEAIGRTVESQEEGWEEAATIARKLREKFDANHKLWEEFLRELRLVRMATTTEVELMIRSVDKLTIQTSAVEALSSALNNLAEALRQPELQRLLK